MFACLFRDHDSTYTTYWQFIPRLGLNGGEIAKEAEAWCHEQFGPRWHGGGPWVEGERWRMGGLSIFIADPTDATAFRLRWC